MNSRQKGNGIRVLLVDDEEFFLDSTSEALGHYGYEVTTAPNADIAIEQLESRFFDVALLDVRMPGMDGIELLRRLSVERPTLQVIMLTGHATIEIAIKAMKLGAFEFLLKPCEVDDLERVISRAAQHGSLERRNIALEGELERTKGSGFIIGESEVIKEIREFIEDAAASDLPVLITGESGTGKELVAQAIHERSKRAQHSIVIVDGSTLREELLASELFGHEKGAFTGAVRKKAGLFEVADKGTLFFDEIGELSPANQSSLLRVLESGKFRPVGALREVSTNVRVITATNKNIKKAVEAGDFRKDLFYRLNGLSVNIPLLREHREDICLLARHFLDRANRNAGTRVDFSADALDALHAYVWPGNIRELKYVVERAALLARKESHINLKHLPEEVRNLDSSLLKEQLDLPEGNLTLDELHQRYERIYIEHLMQKHGGNKSKVSRVLKISPSTLYTKLRRFGLIK